MDSFAASFRVKSFFLKPFSFPSLSTSSNLCLFVCAVATTVITAAAVAMMAPVPAFLAFPTFVTQDDMANKIEVLV